MALEVRPQAGPRLGCIFSKPSVTQLSLWGTWRSDRPMKKRATKIKKAPVLVRDAASGSLVQGAVRSLTGLAARAAEGKCPLCGKAPGETTITLGPAQMKVCVKCSTPVFHFMGLLDFFGGKR